MNPESRRAPPLGPPARHRFRKAGLVASLALLVASGVVDPALAVARSMTGHTTAASRGGDACKPGSHHDDQAHQAHPGGHRGGKDDCKGPTGPTGRQGRRGRPARWATPGRRGDRSDRSDRYEGCPTGRRPFPGLPSPTPRVSRGFPEPRNRSARTNRMTGIGLT